MTARRLHPVLWAVFFLLIEYPAHTCGPDFPLAVFVKQHAPDAPYADFARGRLGIPQPGYRTRHLVIAYRYLTGLPLAPDEQRAAVQADDHFSSTWNTVQQNPALTHSGFLAWIDTRKNLGPVDGFLPQNPFGTQNGWQLDSSFENCLDDAFLNAAHTLQARISTYGAHSPDITEWVRGQDTVFRNCDKPQPTLAALPTSAPQWLRYDRAYQQAAILLYQGAWDQAQTAFSAIAADPHSPWSILSRYLAARVMVTSALSLENYYPPPNPDSGKQPSPDQNRAAYLAQLTAARSALSAMRSEARMHPLTHAIDAMLDRVNARLQPELQARTLALRLTAPTPDPTFYQDLLDLSYLLSPDYAVIKRPAVSVPPPANDRERRADDLLAWIAAFQSGNKTASLEHWNTTPTHPWLLASLTSSSPGDPALPNLLQAAASIASTDPAYPAAIYHRLRLLPTQTPTRAQLLAALAHLSANETPSTRNLFAELNARSAPDLNTWLTQAARIPATEVLTGEDGFDNKPTPQPCGPPLSDAHTPLFPPDIATALNTQLPLRLLVQSAQSDILPPNLRFQIAQAAWTRALLLDRRDAALALAPILIRCNPAWQPVLTAYSRATSPKDRKAAALLALMRFASTEPNVREGNYRPEGFATYSVYRDNWWCYTVPPTEKNPSQPTPTPSPQPKTPQTKTPQTKTSDSQETTSAPQNKTPAPQDKTEAPQAKTLAPQATTEDPQDQAPALQAMPEDNQIWGVTSLAHPEIPAPAFLTPADRAEAAQEIATLRAIPDAPSYLSTQALAWQRASPTDPRAPELLGQAFRVARNACQTKTSSSAEHQLFLTLHTQYPQSPWTTRYRSWQ